MTERQRNKELLNYDPKYQAILFVNTNGSELYKIGKNDTFTFGVMKSIEKYMIENNKNANTLTLVEAANIIKEYRR